MDPLADWEKVGRGVAARDALELVGRHLEDEQERISKVAFAHISRGSLTPELAMALFYQKHAVATLQQSLHRQATQGENAGKRIQEEADQHG